MHSSQTFVFIFLFPVALLLSAFVQLTLRYRSVAHLYGINTDEHFVNFTTGTGILLSIFLFIITSSCYLSRNIPGYMLSASTIKLLRIPFSVFLSPLYFFALSQVPDINWSKAALIFFILHLLIYPASNGYNSYMDRDTESIGGLEKPPPASRQLFLLTIVIDIAAILLSFLISPLFAAVAVLYIGASKAYSYRGIRLKKYPVIGYLTVIIFQGALTFALVYYGSNADTTILGAVAGNGYLCIADRWFLSTYSNLSA